MNDPSQQDGLSRVCLVRVGPADDERLRRAAEATGATLSKIIRTGTLVESLRRLTLGSPGRSS